MIISVRKSKFSFFSSVSISRFSLITLARSGLRWICRDSANWFTFSKSQALTTTQARDSPTSLIGGDVWPGMLKYLSFGVFSQGLPWKAGFLGSRGNFGLLAVELDCLCCSCSTLRQLGEGWRQWWLYSKDATLFLGLAGWDNGFDGVFFTPTKTDEFFRPKFRELSSTFLICWCSNWREHSKF